MSGNHMVVKGWSRWQTYRKDRGTPPWIKVYRNLMTNPDWALLTDADKGHLVSIWIVASDKDGIIPANPRILKKLCMLDDEPNISKFKDLGFIEEHKKPSGNQVVTSCPRLDAPETETETETETEQSKEEKRPTNKCPHDEIISIYNETLSDCLPRVIFSLWNGTRKKTLEARWKEYEERQTLSWWAGYFGTVRASDFLTGKNDRGWKADMGWLINASNIVKVLEGTYKNNTKTNNGYKSKQQVNDEIQSIGANLNEKTRFNPYATIESGNSSGNVNQDKLALPE